MATLLIAPQRSVEPSRFPAAASIRARDDFQEMAVRILEIDAAPAVVMVDLSGFGAGGIGPIGETLLLNAAKRLVELCLGDQEGKMTRRDFALLVHEVEIDAVARRDDDERSP